MSVKRLVSISNNDGVACVVIGAIEKRALNEET